MIVRSENCPEEAIVREAVAYPARHVGPFKPRHLLNTNPQPIHAGGAGIAPVLQP